jgi:low temperature requirement protein LtrA
MTASLFVNFDSYYVPFLIDYIGLRVMTAVQYLMASRTETAYSQKQSQASL